MVIMCFVRCITCVLTSSFNFDLLIYTRIFAHSSNDISDIHPVHIRVLGAVWGTRTTPHAPPVHTCTWIADSVPIRSQN